MESCGHEAHVTHVDLARRRRLCALCALVEHVADLPLVPAGTTLFHATAHAGQFAPMELLGDSYFGVNLFHSCAVMIELVERHPEDASTRDMRLPKSFAIFEYETIVPLLPRDVFKEPGNLEQLQLRHRVRGIRPFMRFVRSIPVDSSILARAASLRPALAYHGMASEQVQLADEWRQMPHDTPIEQAILLREWADDPIAVALLAVWMGTRPSDTLCYTRRRAERVDFDPPVRFMDTERAPASVDHVDAKSVGILVWMRDANAFDTRWVLIGAAMRDNDDETIVDMLIHVANQRLEATSERPLRLAVPPVLRDDPFYARFRAWTEAHDVVMEWS